MNRAGKEIAKVRQEYEDQLSLAKAKLVKAEVKVSTLENTVANKTKENGELMAICDELIQKIDRNKDSTGALSFGTGNKP